MNIFIDKTKLEEYANLVIKVGVNLQPEQELVINADVSDCEFARIIAKVAYQNKGAKNKINERLIKRSN